MNTKTYIKTFHLDREGNFNRKAFMKVFSDEFLERLESTRIARINQGLEFEFRIFLNIVKEMQNKFWAISNKKVGEPFTKDFFGWFYSNTVIPARKKYFPDEDHKIALNRAMYNKTH